MTTVTDLSGVESGDTICSIRDGKKWVRVLQDCDGKTVYINKLKVERSINGNKWILCLYKKLTYGTHVFYLDLDKTKIKIWKK